MALSEPGPFFDVLRQHGPAVQLFFGHVHRAVHGTMSGVRFTAQRGISVQFALDLKAASTAADAAPPSYGVILVENGRLVVHEEAFATGWIRYDVQTGTRLDARGPEETLAVMNGGA